MIPLPWTVTVHDRTLLITLPTSYQVLSWAPLGGGLVEARAIFNHHVRTDEYLAQDPVAYLRTVAQRLGLSTQVVGLMTGVKMERVVRHSVQHASIVIECFATVGLSNALAVGDVATYQEHPGTINIIVMVNQPLTAMTLVEAIAIVTEAKVRALYAAGVKSTVSEALATGTGTDCVAIACPPGTPAYQYCGKHTQLGEFLGRIVCDAVAQGLRQARDS